MAAQCRDAVRLLVDNPDLAKTILAGGLLCSCLSVGGPLVLTEIKSEVWGKSMSSNSAAVAIAAGLVSVVLGGFFGRLTDHIERRLAMGLVGFLNFFQWYSLVIIGPSSVGLYTYCAFQICAGVTCMTQTGCPMIFTLVSDVMPKDNSEFAFGVAYSGVYMTALFFSLIGVFIARRHPGVPQPVMYYICALSITFFFVLATIRHLPVHRRKPSDSADSELPSEAEGREGNSSSVCKKTSKAWKVIMPVRFACENPALLNLCFCAGLICLPEIVLADVQQQYIYEELGLLGTHNRSRKQLASLLSTYPGILASLPAYFLVGLAGKQVGVLRLFKCMIPAAACMMTFPVLLSAFPYIEFVPVAGIMLQLSLVLFTPLQTINAQIAPDDRVGEAMAVVGVSKQLSAVVANLGVHSVVPMLQRAGLEHCLRYFFPAAGALCLLSLVFAARIEDSRIGSPQGDLSDNSSDEDEDDIDGQHSTNSSSSDHNEE